LASDDIRSTVNQANNGYYGWAMRWMTDSPLLKTWELRSAVRLETTRPGTAGCERYRWPVFAIYPHPTVKMQSEVIVLFEALTGQAWDSSNNLYGLMYTRAGAARIRAEEVRLDHRLLMGTPKWSEPERDDTRMRALPEHMEEAVKRVRRAVW